MALTAMKHRAATAAAAPSLPPSLPPPAISYPYDSTLDVLFPVFCVCICIVLLGVC